MNIREIGLNCPSCGEEISVECEIEPADNSYGSDADGNRGIRVPAFLIPGDIPGACACGHVFNEDECRIMAERLEWKCQWYGLD